MSSTRLKSSIKTRLIALAVIAGACACGDDNPANDDETGQPPPLPSLPKPIIAVVPHIATPNDIALEARGLVRGQLQRVQLELVPIAQRLQSFAQQRYASDGRGRWIAEGNGGFPACTSTFSMERSGAGLLWRWVWNGFCGGSTEDVDRELSTMSTALDGSSGRLDDLWGAGPVGGGMARYTRLEWHVAPPLASWRRLSRQSDPPTLEITFEQRPGEDDGTEYELRREGVFRWVLQSANDGTHGAFTLDRWQAGSWIRSELVTWEGEHGTWRSDPELGEARERSW